MPFFAPDILGVEKNRQPLEEREKQKGSEVVGHAFAHLRVHTAYSLLEGAIHIEKLGMHARTNAIPAIGVSERDSLFSAFEATRLLSEAGIQPIIGTMLGLVDTHDVAEKPSAHPVSGHMAPANAQKKAAAAALCEKVAHVTLLVKNAVGYKNLMALTSASYAGIAHGARAAYLPIDALRDRSEGLFCLTGGVGGFVQTALARGESGKAQTRLESLRAIFGESLFVELQRRKEARPAAGEAFLIDAAHRASLGVVATNPAYFLTKEDHQAHDALLCIASGRYLQEEDRPRSDPEAYVKSAAEMHALFADIPEAAANTLHIARRCTFFLSPRKPILPLFGKSGRSDAQELRRAALAGIKQRRITRENPASEEDIASGQEDAAENKGAMTSEDHASRIRHELDVIISMGYAGYFLIVADFITWAKQQGIPVGPGRGSGAGSLVAYALGITDIDPLRYGLIFERFLNPQRVSLPDFDVDFCQERRDEVIDYVRKRYGDDKVAHIITFGRLQARAVVRDVGRVLSMPYLAVNALCRHIPNHPSYPVTLTEAIAASKALKEEMAQNERVRLLMTIARKLEGLCRHASTHAAGIVIADRPLDTLAPLYRDRRSVLPVTQYTMGNIEQCGLIKFDFLGLKTLTMIRRVLSMIGAGDKGEALIPLDDEKTYALLCSGRTTGVFQMESRGMQRVLKNARPQRIEDVIALLSLYRPGPMENIPAYIANKNAQQERKILHPALEGLLEETYGVIIYQEQVMRIAQLLAGFSAAQADVLRRAMGKKKKAEMEGQRRLFVEGACARGVGRRNAEEVFALVEKFAGYGFNKSHAAAYAVLTLRQAYLKAHHPAAFFAASMSLEVHNTDRLAIFIRDARHFGVSLHMPDINRSQVDFFLIGDKQVVYGLGAIKGLGAAMLQEVIEEREQHGPFADIFDFLVRVDAKKLGKKNFEILAAAGAFDKLHANRGELVANADKLIRWAGLHAKAAQSAQIGLFVTKEYTHPVFDKVQAWSQERLLEEERTVFGAYARSHPLELVEKQGTAGNVELGMVIELLEAGKSRTRDVYAHIDELSVRRTRRGKNLVWAMLSDASDQIEVMVFEEVAQKYSDLLKARQLVMVTLGLAQVKGESRLHALHFQKARSGKPPLDEPLCFSFQDAPADIARLQALVRDFQASGHGDQQEASSHMLRTRLIVIYGDCGLQAEYAARLPEDQARFLQEKLLAVAIDKKKR